MNQKEFFARVLPSGNHYIAYPGGKAPNGRVLWSHKSFTEPYEGVQEAARTHRWGKDVYFAVASFREAQRPDPARGEGKTRSWRKQENVAALKSLYLDVDFKAYDSPEDTINAVAEFLSNSKIQKPTIIVRTGGGLHLYWTFPHAIPLVEWQPLANGLAGLAENFGLRADLQCTIDSARILRVPETLNHKYDPPRLVEVMAERAHDIDMAEMGMLLSGVVSLRVKGRQRPKSAVAPGLVLDPEVAAMFPNSLASDLSAGLHAPQQQDRYAREIVKGCPTLGDSFARGGDGDSRDLWNNMLLLMAYTRDGREYAHLLSKGDPRYTPEETEREFDMKVVDADKLGPTTCATFNRLSSHCATCPHFNKIKSPISLGVEPVEELEVVRLDEPTRVQDGNTYTLCKFKDGSVNWVPFITGGELQRPEIINDTNGKNVLRITIRTTYGKTYLNLECKLLRGRDYLVQAFNERLFNVDGKLAADTMTAWMDLLRRENGDTEREKAFGWSNNGFSIAGVRYDKDDGVTNVVSVNEYAANNYAVKGSLEPWQDIVNNHILKDPRIELQTILATAFAASLIHFTEHDATVVVLRSPQSGIGKTSIMRISRAIWGNPRDMSHANDTALAAEGRLATLTNMPWYWDELKIQGDQNTSNIIYQIIQGRSKERNSPSGENRPTHETRGMLVIATNSSIYEMMREANPNTDAGTYRVLEIELPPREDSATDIEFNYLLRQLNDNYGHIGIAYAKILAKLQHKLPELMLRQAKEIQAIHPTTLPERFWMSSTCALILSAKIAKAAGLVDFNIEAIQKSLLNVVGNYRDTNVANDSPTELAGKIYSFFKRRSFVTDKFDLTPGPGMPKRVHIIEQPGINAEDARVRLAVIDNILAISEEGVGDYAKATQQQKHLVLEKLHRIGTTKDRINLDKGMSNGSKMRRERVIVIKASDILGQDAITIWAAAHPSASPGSSSGTAPTSSTTP